MRIHAHELKKERTLPHIRHVELKFQGRSHMLSTEGQHRGVAENDASLSTCTDTEEACFHANMCYGQANTSAHSVNVCVLWSPHALFAAKFNEKPGLLGSVKS